MYRLIITAVVIVSVLINLHAQSLQDKRISIVAANITIEQVLEKLGHSECINFSYQSNLKSLNKKITITLNEMPLLQALTEILENSGLTFKVFSNQIIIQSLVTIPKRILLEGRICISGTYDPVPYAGIELKYLHKATIADYDGRFRLEIEDKNLTDTLRISSLNYNVFHIPARGLAGNGQHTLFLTPRVYNLPAIEINDNSLDVEEMGNHKWFRRGSLYIDTHGQQTALFIRNEKKVSGKIISVGYNLSSKGNTNAPFRVRVYECDSLTGRPGDDMLPEILVVKPNKGKGWFHVNIARYNLQIPKNGFFVALEGVFPDDYDVYYQGSEFKGKPDTSETEDEDFTDADLQYGQQLGYTHGSTNYTWHYAIDRTWFQLKKGHFNAMISAGIRVVDYKKKWKIFKIFQRHENNNVDN